PFSCSAPRYPRDSHRTPCGCKASCCMLYVTYIHEIHHTGLIYASAVISGDDERVDSAMRENTEDYQMFRARLDAVLREKSPQRLKDFLVAEGQWPENPTTDVDAALWMMIATSPALADQHQEAKSWLLAHGHEAEVQAIFGGRRSGEPKAGKITGRSTSRR